MQQIIPRASPSRKALSSFICQSCRRSLRRFSASTNRRSGGGGVPPPPPSGYAHLSSRRLISVAGPDAPRFLHGIITRSVVAEPSTSGGRRFNRTTNANANATADAAANSMASTPGFYAAFLNATGRVLHDVFVYRDTLGLSGGAAAEGEAFVIEVDADQVDVLAQHIKRYKLRSKLACRVLDAEECAAWQVWDSNSSSPPTPTPTPQGLATQLSQLQNSIVLPDTRAPGMGTRVLRLGGGGGAGHLLDVDLEKSDEAAYRVRRYLLGVAEGQAEIPREQALPLEANMDVSGGVDFRKGCYVGQELTIRTRHRGVVRKRILPCLLYPSSSSSPSPPPPGKLEYSPWIGGGEGGGEEQGEGKGEEGQDTLLSAEDVPPNLSIGRDGAKGRSAGTWLRGVGNVGLALCRLQIMTDVELPGETAAAPFNPDKDEFVVKWGADEEGGGGQSVKIKAFVPDWLRERLNEDKNASSAH